MKLFSTDLKNYINYDRLISIVVEEHPMPVVYVDNIPYIIITNYIKDLKNGYSYYNQPISPELKKLALSFIDDFLCSDFKNLRNHLIEHVDYCSYAQDGLFMLFDDSSYIGARLDFLKYISRSDVNKDNKLNDAEFELIVFKVICSKENYVVENIKEIHIDFGMNSYIITVPKNVEDVMDWFHRKYIFDYSFKSNLKI